MRGTEPSGATTPSTATGRCRDRSRTRRDRLVVAALKAGLERRDVGPSFTCFKGVRVAPDGALVLEAGPGPVGAAITLRCDLGVHAAVANVPHVLDDRSDYACTALRITAWVPDESVDDDSPTPETQRAQLNTLDWLGGRG